MNEGVKCRRCTDSGWVPDPNPETRSWIWCECHPERKQADEDFLRAVIGGLKLARNVHPEIDYAGFESSIAKRVVGAIRSRGKT